MDRTTLVTGATGYLGGRLVEQMVRRGETGVRALVRKTSLTDGLEKLGVDLVEGDLGDSDSLRRAMRDVGRVFHAGAYVTRWTRQPELFDKINVAGTRAVLDAALEEGVSSFVYTSSFMALGPSGDSLADEGICHRGEYRNEYERTKKLALDLARGYVGKGLGLKMLCPGVIFGPGALTEGNLVAGIIRDYLRRMFPLLGDGSKRWCFSFIDDVVAGHLASSREEVEEGIYIVGGENLSMAELQDLLHRLTDVAPMRMRMPFGVAKAAGWLNELLAPLGVPVKLTRGEVEIFRHNWAYSSAKAEMAFGYRVTPMDEAMKRTVDWVRAELGV